MSAQSRLARFAPFAGFGRPHAARRRKVRQQVARRRLLLVIAVGVLGALALVGWFWLRDSSLVAVDHVTVLGASGPDAAKITRALSTEARTMTTLDVRTGDLRSAVAPYPVVKQVRASAQFPHGLRITVIEQIPIGLIQSGGRMVAIASDGTVLRDVVAPASLPVIEMRVPPGGSKIGDARGAALVALLAAAPYRLLTHIGQVTSTADHGLVAQLRAGPAIYFGASVDLQAKWAAAAAVLTDSGSAGAAYIDVNDPHRPAAGVPPAPASATAAGGATSSAAGSPTSSGGG